MPVWLSAQVVILIFIDNLFNLQVKFYIDNKPKLLPLDSFDADYNTLSSKFQGCVDGNSFVARWKEHIEPYLSCTGEYSDVDSEARSEPSSQKRKSSMSKDLLPVARQCLLSEDDESSMDKTIREHFLGKHEY